MKLSRVAGYVLVLAVTLGVVGWSAKKWASTPVTPAPVNIGANCKVDNDEVKASIGGTIRWNPPSPVHSYSIDFTKESPFATLSVAAGADQPVTGTKDCNWYSVFIPNNPNCLFPYNLSKDSAKPCADPGVRIVRPNISLIYLLLVLGFGGFVGWRISARKLASPAK